MQVNPKVASSKMATLLEQKWKEFLETKENLKASKDGEGERAQSGDESEESINLLPVSLVNAPSTILHLIINRLVLVSSLWYWQQLLMMAKLLNRSFVMNRFSKTCTCVRSIRISLFNHAAKGTFFQFSVSRIHNVKFSVHRLIKYA